MENATHTIQVNGGMGYTFEHDAHLFLKRARVLGRVFGESAQHLFGADRPARCAMTPAAVPPLVGEFPSLPDALDAALISATEDRKEGVRSFIEGRSPNFIGD